MTLLNVPQVSALSGEPRGTLYRWADEHPEKGRGPRPTTDPLRPWARRYRPEDVAEWLHVPVEQVLQFLQQANRTLIHESR